MPSNMRTYKGLITSPQFAAPATGPTLPHGPTFAQQNRAISAPQREYNEQLWSMGQVFNEPTIDPRQFE